MHFFDLDRGIITVKKSAGLAINGAFLHRDAYPEGRVATEYLRAFQSLKQELRYQDLLYDLDILLCEKPFREIEGLTANYKQSGKLPRPIWQQLLLPFLSKEKTLLNFCNIAPMFKSNSVAFIHDANVYKSPISYSKAYVLYTKLLNAFIGRNAKRVFTVSQYAGKALIEQGIATPETLHVIPNGADHIDRANADTTILAKHRLPKNGYVLGLSNSYKHKNMQVLMDVFDNKASKQSGVNLPLVLFGPDMKETFQDEGIEPSNQVVFTGIVSDGERRALYENALCFGFPSKHEGFGLPPAEAMRLGCPVIATRSASIPEICGEAVIYADPDASHSWREAILAFSNDDTLRDEYATLGKAQAAQFTWEKSARLLLDQLLGLEK